MLKIRREIIEKLRATTNLGDVIYILENAVMIEFTTIPPYLTALFSIIPQQNPSAQAIPSAQSLMHSVVLEEMLHMTLAANTMIAIGGNPRIYELGIKLRYPASFPMNVDEGLQAHLTSLTSQQARAFMEIEYPDTNALLPGEKQSTSNDHSIGDFYDEVIQALIRLNNLGKGIFSNPRLDHQIDVAQWFPFELNNIGNGKVSSLDSAQVVLKEITAQGEGVQIRADPIDPYNGGREYAHYFKFGEIFYGRQLVGDRNDPSGFSYTGPQIPLAICNLLENAAVSDYEKGSDAYITGSQFYETYRRLLKALDETFNGYPESLNSAMGIMFELKLAAQKVIQSVELIDPSTGKQCHPAPPFMPDHDKPATSELLSR
ncbi:MULTISPECIES: ferritin-like domain-containing protein [Burkholderia]|uniref:ferritin-like domain-containing protein n=1 Tax=Burkholderia TaxID=32008 RepID=UPI000841492D|nr:MULTISPECIES: ferritin-like protein [unclassified Burkholderia]AOK32265.1 hypothetical protein AQ611_22765 [Burkholderia sp. Bp7605]